MYQVTVTAFISAAHHLRGYQGKCEKAHGHNYKVEATAQAQSLDDTGLAIDFGILRKHLREIAERLDHQDLNTMPEFQDQNPSSENISRTIYEDLEKRLAGLGVEMVHVRVWETEGSFITYSKTA